MSSDKTAARFSRRSVIAGLVLLAGCGFTPVYGINGAASKLRGAVAFETPDTVDGYRLREQLARQLGEPAAAAYRLTVTQGFTESPVAVSSDNVAARNTLSGVADYALIDASGTTVTNGRVSAFVGYSTTGNTVTTRAAEKDAHERLAIQLADLIVIRLQSAFVIP